MIGPHFLLLLSELVGLKEVAILRNTQEPPYWFYLCVSTDTNLSVDTPFTAKESDNIVQT